jgi:hypothetical protein
MDITIDNTSLSSLSNDIYFGSFLKTIKQYQSQMAYKDADQKLIFYRKLAKYLTDKLGIPTITLKRVEFMVDEKGKKDYLAIGETDFEQGNLINFTNRRLFDVKKKPEAQLIEYLKVSVTVYHELRHVEQLFLALKHHYYKKVKLGLDYAIPKLGVNIWSAAMKTPIPKYRDEFAEIMAKAIIYEEADDRSRPYEKRIVERDGYNFGREGYRILNSDRNWGTTNQAKKNRKIDDSWYPEATNEVEKGNPNDPTDIVGYIDKKYAGLFSQRIDLASPKYIVIPI